MAGCLPNPLAHDFRGACLQQGRAKYAYGPAQPLPNSRVGSFTQALYNEPTRQGWIATSMKKDWKRVFAFD